MTPFEVEKALWADVPVGSLILAALAPKGQEKLYGQG